MRVRKRCIGILDRRNRRKKTVAHPDGEAPTGQTRTSTIRQLSCRRFADNSTSGCGPAGSPAGMPLFIRIPRPALPRLPERAAPGLRRVRCHIPAPAYIALRAT